MELGQLNRKQWVLIPFPVWDESEIFCTTYWFLVPVPVPVPFPCSVNKPVRVFSHYAIEKANVLPSILLLVKLQKIGTFLLKQHHLCIRHHAV